MTHPKKIKKNAREAAYLAVLEALQQKGFISDYLDQWKQAAAPSPLDYDFAQRIAIGTMQMALTLDYLAQQLSEKKKLTLKLKERALLRTALYQYYFMDRVPLHAIADETVTIAKKRCHSIFGGYLNAILRKLPEHPSSIPQGDSPYHLMIRYSFPDFFIQQLLAQYDLATTKEILEASNHPSLTMMRVRTQEALPEGVEDISISPFHVVSVKDNSLMPVIVTSPNYYIQNITPMLLMDFLRQDQPTPKRILDLCASPGGKLLLAHEFFPKAKLYANDISEKKMEALTQNCTKYGMSVSLSSEEGQYFPEASRPSERFDLVILDVPCSNSGVLNKRPEARWRIDANSLTDLESTQLELIESAQRLLATQGQIWYLTCSILKQENEQLMELACQRFGLKIIKQKTSLPQLNGSDGGFCCLLCHA